MMNELLLIIGSACVGFSFAEVSGIPQAFANFLYNKFDLGNPVKGYQYIKTPYRLKPFDCGYCLSFWFSFLASYYIGYELLFALIFGFMSSIVAIILKKVL